MVHPVDVIVGKRIRMRRIALSLSQTELASRLGLTFQQIQKYEKGTNRVSCSRLVQLSEALNTSIPYFFEDVTAEVRVSDALDLEGSKDALRLVSAFQKIKNVEQRRLAVSLLETIAESDN